MWHMKVKRVLPHIFFHTLVRHHTLRCALFCLEEKARKLTLIVRGKMAGLQPRSIYIYSTLLTSDRCPLYSSLRKVLSPLLNFPCFLQCNIGSVSSKKWQKTSDFFSTSVSFHTLREHVNGQSGCTFVGCAARHGDPIGQRQD